MASVVAAVADRGHRPNKILAGVTDPSSSQRVPHRHLRRLERIWVDSPIYFVTACTKGRRAVLGLPEIAEILIEEWKYAHDRHGRAVGRYVIMPDHVHFFCRPEYVENSLRIDEGLEELVE